VTAEDSVIYLDNAATSWPKPETVYETLGGFLRVAGANPGRAGHRMAVEAANTVSSTRNAIHTLVNAESAERVIFTANATDSLNLAIRGLLRPGDHAITSSMEHNSVIRPLRDHERSGGALTVVWADECGAIEPARIEEAVRADTRLIAITHASNVTGAVMPIADIADIARRHNVLLLVDGAQTVGARAIDVQNAGVDLLAFPGHKGLLGPTGTGGLYIGPRVDLERFIPLRSGGTGVHSEDDAQPLELPWRYEAGTANTVGIAALGAGVTYVSEQGVDALFHHERDLMIRMNEGLRSINGVHLFETSPSVPAAAVCSFTIDGWEPGDAGAVLDSSFEIACRVGLHCAPLAIETIKAGPRGTIRFSPGPFTTSEEIDQAIEAVAELAESPLS
jgi:cysteine desulfurase family protein